jgi:hypothetical protein
MRTLICLCFLALTFTATSQDSGLREVDVQATILGQSGGEMSVSQLQDIEQMDAPANHRIISCKFTQVEDGQVYIKVNDGYVFNDEIKHRISETVVGESLYFEDIIAQDAKGEKVRLPYIKVTITE